LSGRSGSTGSSARTEMDLLFSVDRCAGAEEPTRPEDCVMMFGRFYRWLMSLSQYVEQKFIQIVNIVPE
jgi:hypothetical protein